MFCSKVANNHTSCFVRCAAESRYALTSKRGVWGREAPRRRGCPATETAKPPECGTGGRLSPFNTLPFFTRYQPRMQNAFFVANAEAESRLSGRCRVADVWCRLACYMLVTYSNSPASFTRTTTTGLVGSPLASSVIVPVMPGKFAVEAIASLMAARSLARSPEMPAFCIAPRIIQAES